ncbi:MAG TPA: hypothetical protein PKM44_01735 [Turneriella sp.]|nr:hypothetical protein [Turneriella sp.]HMY10425.1 hypothetical protein [Turneriella sp.]HNA79819.1 hypothetical protein [Turneriella sp.]HNJ64400.1 hypothetical protein [Turneriella sp.]HNL09203.1 hypothetical protein [Turneriella sp.]
MENKGLYRDFHRIDLSHLRQLAQEKKIESGIAQNLLAYWQRRLDDKNDAIYFRYMEYYLFFESLRALFLAVFIFDMKNGMARHSYGIFPALSPAIFQSISTGLNSDAGAVSFEHGGHDYSLHYIRSGYHDQEYTIAALALKDVAIEDNLKRMKYVFERYYLPSSFSRDERIGNLFPEVQNLIKEWVNPALAEKQPVTFTYLYFESLTKYVGLAGEHFAQDLIRELKQDVHRVLKDTDRSIILSTREILIVSVNCEEEIMRKRFANAYFHAKSLLLAYQVNFFCIKEPVADMHSLWDQVSANLAYKKKVS